MLNRDVLRPEANALFDSLKTAPAMQNFTLIGGTALALQIGHRTSLDFDFAQFGGVLPGFELDQLMARLKSDGHQVQMITSPALISGFKINRGLNLLNFARDYVINGVKVTFFIHGKNEMQQAFYQQAERLCLKDISFNILGIEGLKVAKTLVLADRVRSRDLYDLYILMRDHGYTVEAMFGNIKTLGTVDDPEHYKAILRGEIPVDKEDEGLDAIALNDASERMVAFFNVAINDYEVRLAQNFFCR